VRVVLCLCIETNRCSNIHRLYTHLVRILIYTIRTNSHHAHRTFEIGRGSEGQRDQEREEREGEKRRRLYL
jgi:hypothetical protein